MARSWTRPLFRTAFLGDEISVSVRRSIGMIDLESPSLIRLQGVCGKLKLKWESPIAFRKCYAHIGIPSRRVAIFIRTCTDFAKFKSITAEWKSCMPEWKVLFATNSQIDQMTDDEISAHLTSAIKEVTA